MKGSLCSLDYGQPAAPLAVWDCHVIRYSTLATLILPVIGDVTYREDEYYTQRWESFLP